MELKRIQSAELPNIDVSVKECVNEGRWTLFRTHQAQADETIEYYIKGNASLYRLNKLGEVVSIGSIDDAPQIDEIIYFADVATPSSVSENRKTFASLVLA